MHPEQARNSSKPRRPTGVWILTICNLIAAFLYVLMAAPWFMFPPRHAMMPPEPISWVFLLLIITVLGASYGTWRGSIFGRNVLVACSALFALIVFYAFGSGLFTVFRSGESQRTLVINELLEASAIVGTWIVWAGFQVWYLLRKKTRLFFQDRSASQRWFASRGMAIVALGIPLAIFGSIEAAYQSSGPARNPPHILASQLRTSPGAGLSDEEAFNRFPFVRQDVNPLEADESQKFTALLKTRFPDGTIETALIAVLQEEGFYPPSMTDMDHDGDPEKTVEYGWWRFDGWRRGKCQEGVHVHWSAITTGAVTDVRGEYFKVCGFLLEPRHWIW